MYIYYRKSLKSVNIESIGQRLSLYIDLLALINRNKYKKSNLLINYKCAVV